MSHDFVDKQHSKLLAGFIELISKLHIDNISLNVISIKVLRHKRYQLIVIAATWNDKITVWF